MAEKQQPLTLSPREAAPMIPMGINQFYAAVREGVVPSLRIGNSIRIPRKKFIAWLNGDNVTPGNNVTPGDHRTPQDAA